MVQIGKPETVPSNEMNEQTVWVAIHSPPSGLRIKHFNEIKKYPLQIILEYWNILILLKWYKDSTASPKYLTPSFNNS